jgi:hypothetical protein
MDIVRKANIEYLVADIFRLLEFIAAHIACASVQLYKLHFFLLL